VTVAGIGRLAGGYWGRVRDHGDDEHTELRALRRRVAHDAGLIDDLRDVVAHEAGEIDELRRQLARSDRDWAAADTQRAAQATLIARLREEADVRDAELAAVQSRIAASELELEDLRAVRDALTPAELPDRPGLEITASFLPATPRVSGDFYLAAPGSEDTTMIVVGDVVGKGVEAARDAAFLRTAFATIAGFSDDPCQLLGWANAAFRERVGSAARFATAACLTFDPATRRLRWALAGHPAPLRLDSGDELAGGRRSAPLGVDETVGCLDADWELAAGEGLLLYTDGLTEARRNGRLFGVERAQAVIRTMRGHPSADVLARLRDDAAAFCGGQLGDDLCLVAVHGT
jgi:serine phosphatase RsbU (regulator of sigma subunit)